MENDVFGARKTMRIGTDRFIIYQLRVLEQAGLTNLEKLPFSIRVLLESVLRRVDGRRIKEQDVVALAGWSSSRDTKPSVPFLPERVVMQDLTGVPAVVDLAAMRSALARMGCDPSKINPQVPVDLVIDHSVQVDFFRTPEALQRNAEVEFQRNRERFEFLRWGQEVFNNLRIVPPSFGIIHQINLEYLSKVVLIQEERGVTLAFPDTLVGTDSHTTMINGLGVLGWGVGGIEAEAAILGQPLVMQAPEVIGFRLHGRLSRGITATDLVLTVTQMLRAYGVVGKFVEFFGPGLSRISLPDRATIANMAPEYGATVGYFPVDEETLRYLRLTGREEDLIDLVECYFKEQGIFRTEQNPDPVYSEVLELDLGTVETSLAGPKRPQDRIPLSHMKTAFREVLSSPTSQGGYGLSPEVMRQTASIQIDGSSVEVSHGMVVIAAITSCTNTSNPNAMVAAGLLAKKAVERGLQAKPYVKTSMAPGSRVVTEYLREGGLLEPLAELGFNVVGYGCMTCIGNSGPLPSEVVAVIHEVDLVSVGILSGNRNFEGRISPNVRANYLASPPLVVVYALTGTTDIDLMTEPLGYDASGKPIYLHEIWPTQEEIQQVIEHFLTPTIFRDCYSKIFSSNEAWKAIPIAGGNIYEWDPESTYIMEPPFFIDLTPEPPSIEEIRGARALALLGDSVTTDHISPAGAIPVDSQAGRYLINRNVDPRDFNTFGCRRGNDRVMTRGTFDNIRLRNRLVPSVDGGVTLHFPDGERMSIYEAAVKYKEEGVPLIVLAGLEYGTGSSRDWAAKGTLLLGVRVVIAESFERIHRANLVGMGVLPLEFMPGESVDALGLTGHEFYNVLCLNDDLEPGAIATVRADKEDGAAVEFNVRVRIDTQIEIEYYRNGGILHMVLRQMIRNQM